MKKKRKYEPEQKRKWHLKQRYGLEFGEYEQRLKEQNSCCFICKKKSEKYLYVDHNHMTKEVRKLLCPLCNTMVGYVEKNSERVLQVQEYLKEHSDKAN